MADVEMAAAAAPAAAGAEAGPRSRAKAWCFTWNNPTHKNLFPDGLPEAISYLVYQLERGKEGTPHLQGYVYFSKQATFNTVKQMEFKTPDGASVFPFRQAHLEVAKGKPEHNKAYCTKADTRVEGPWELGNCPGGQGDRSDLREAAVELQRTGDIRSIDPAIFLKYASGCLKLAALAPPPRRDNLKVITIVGPSGIGKSYAVHDLYPDVYVVNMGNAGLWWDGYTGQSAVLFEEFKGQVQLQKMLQILDPYPLRLEIKGGLVPARFSIVFITSNTMPSEWYENKEGRRDAELAALDRRLDTESPTNHAPVRFIHVDARDELHRRLDRAMTIADLTPKPKKRLTGLPPPVVIPARPAPVVAAAAAPPSPKTPEIPDGQCQFVRGDDGAPRLKRHKAHITLLDAPHDADAMTDADTGEVFIRDDIMADWASANRAPAAYTDTPYDG